jgi:peptide/nickel transport system substrate-binding protein
MSDSAPKGKFSALYEQLQAGKLSRREFTFRALALGVGLPVISFVLRAETARATGMNRNSGWAVLAAQGAAARPAVGMEGKKRGEGGELKLIQWQAPTVLSPHVSTGTKDYLASSIVLEPLMNYLPDGTLIPNLVTEVPTVDNGMLKKDLSGVTYKLLDGIKWSDGQPFTADDVVYTWQWIMNPANASVSSGVYSRIKDMKATDPTTVEITFNEPTANWFEPHTGTTWGYVYPKHVLGAGGDQKAANDAFLAKPTGTGPYKVDSFSPNDQVIYVANENFRDPNSPYFAKINLKGGGDATSAARAVLQTGEYDYAWNLQVEPQILNQLLQGGKGTVPIPPGTSVERIELQFADPNKEVDGQRAEVHTKNPTISDKAVRQAINLAVQRDVISKELYAGDKEPPTANILAGLPSMTSKNTSWEFNLDKAKQILDQGGWVDNGGVRKKGDVDLSVTYVTSINSVRQKEQAIVKQALEKLGFKVELRQVDSGIFFDSSPGNEQNIGHFYNDLQMYTNNVTTPIPTAYMLSWYGGPDLKNIAQKSNGWSGQNDGRWHSDDYDKLFEEVEKTTDLEKAAQLFIQMNDMVIDDVVIVPIVNRSAGKYAIANTLHNENVALSDFEVDYWNIRNWNRKS